jgi:hypothetical protein
MFAVSNLADFFKKPLAEPFTIPNKLKTLKTAFGYNVEPFGNNIQNFRSNMQVNCYNQCATDYPLIMYADNFQYPNRMKYSDCLVNCDQKEYPMMTETGVPYEFEGVPQKLPHLSGVYQSAPIETFNAQFLWSSTIYVMIVILIILFFAKRYYKK